MLQPFSHTADSNESNLSPEEYERYAKHIIIPEIQVQGQLRLQQSRVLSIGAGGLASASLLYLASSGIGAIGIIDNDNVEKSNLHRQLLYKDKDIGASKSLCAQQTLNQVNPLCSIEIFKKRFNSYNAYNIVKDYDIILDHTDNFETRWLISKTCQKLHKIHIYGAISTFMGQISVFNFQGGPNYSDLNQSSQRQYTNVCNSNGVLSVLPGLIGLLQATETIKIILGLGDILSGKIMLYNLLEHQFKIIYLQQNYHGISQGQLDNYLQNRYITRTFQTTISILTLENMLRKNKQIYLIDIRENQEYEIEHLFGAINVPLQKFKSYHNQALLAKQSINKTIILYCNSILRTHIASLIMFDKSIPHFILQM
uniref:Molybdopterin biosynthesis protein n=1 Tax=Liagora harveyana TaxID=406718 RepID=A0A1G4NVW6_9FLOR|nr:Molybdopterin biosynthesis protein [Liagora harveyana]SCW22656.1 Molybdopterin biosynthesis protein [Liagora harveyana]